MGEKRNGGERERDGRTGNEKTEREGGGEGKSKGERMEWRDRGLR